MTPLGFESWLAIESPDQVLENILKGLSRFASVDLRQRPRMSLEWKDGAALLRAANPDALFDRIFSDRPARLRVLSLAPYSALRRFHNKVFQYQGSRYRIRSCRAEFPYYRRFLDFEYLEAGVQLDTGEMQTKVERTGPQEINPDCLLWIDPQLVELDEDQVSYLFDFTSTKSPLGSDMHGAMFLPPVRTAAHPAMAGVLRAEEGQSESGSYFCPELIAIRRALLEYATSGRVHRDEPTAVTIARLVDDPLLRDILLDGGRVRVNSAEGQPTTLSLDIGAGPQPGAQYRASAVLNPDAVPGAEWNRALMRAIRDDVADLVDGGWSIGAGSPSTAEELPRWGLRPMRPYRAGGYDGTWTQIQRLSAALSLSPSLRNIFEHRVLLPTRERADGNSPPDNDLAELLLIHDLWRCPWSDNVDVPPWRQAMLDLLRHGFSTSGLSPEQRVDSWNGSTGGTGDADGFSFAHGRRVSDGAMLLRYSGSPDDASVLKWRLLLPLGSIINARTLFLDMSARSQLDCGFVLA